jgi:hypothetical protein
MDAIMGGVISPMMKLHIQLADVVTDIAFARMRNGKISLGYTHPVQTDFKLIRC